MMLLGRFAVLSLLIGALVACGDAAGAPAGRVLQFVGEPRVTIQTGNFLHVEGRVKNTHATRSYIGNIGITLFDADGKIIGTAVATVVNLPPGEEITYTAAGANAPASWAKVEQKITVEGATP
ncbi:MAG TPA: FxLYD domain-containing protein [Chloroflexota bacterium]|nr:FxLYD domain-containing protein [Chloroflexota bacterium]